MSCNRHDISKFRHVSLESTTRIVVLQQTLEIEIQTVKGALFLVENMMKWEIK